MHIATTTYLLATAALSILACSDDATPAIDAPDVPTDAAIDAAGCGSDFLFTGAYVDWDSTTSAFSGVFESMWTLPGPPPRTVLTNPNGRVELCIPPSGVSLLTATRADYLPAVFVAEPDVFESPGLFFFSTKGLKTARAASFYTSIGLTFDATKAHVLVEKQHAAISLSLTGGGAAFAVDNPDDLTWAPGTSGGVVLFANVDPAGGEGALSSSSSFVGPASLPLRAGTLTLLTIR